MKTRVLALSALLAVFSVTAFGEDLPKAADLIKKAQDAQGGKAAMMKVKSHVDKGKLTLPDMGMEATYTSYVQPPNSLNVSDFNGQGVVKNGQTDGTSWTVNPFQGNSRRPAGRPADIFPLVNIDQLAATAKTLGEENVGDKPAYKVEAQAPNGPITFYFDKATGLVAKSETKNADGSVASTTFADYKKVGDLTLPHSITQEGGPFKLVIVSESIELDAAIPAGTFDIPADVPAQ